MTIADSEFIRLIKIMDVTIAISNNIEGFLTPLEGCALHYLAAHGPGEGCVVELGSFFGRSTAFLATGCRSTNRGWVAAVDHFTGSPENRKGGFAETKELVEQGTTYPVFQANMQKFGLSNYVKVFNQASTEVAKNWTTPVRLLFIDADHSYEGSSSDFNSWEPFVTPGGYICFHDIDFEPFQDGVTRFYNELLANNPNFRQVARVNSLGIVEKIS